VQISHHTSLKPIFARLTKVDEETRTVTGRACQELVDRDNEMMDYDSSKPEFMKWSAEVHADTGGKPLGNVRAMHGNVAAGVLTDIRFEDVEKAIDVSAHIVDDQEWKKIVSGTYAGFSIGGRYSKRWSEPINGRMVTKYTAVPSEISIVDRPCIPTAKFFTIHKRDGSTVEQAFSLSSEIALVNGKIELLQKGSDDQPRDADGRFGSGGGHREEAVKQAKEAREQARNTDYRSNLHRSKGLTLSRSAKMLTDKANSSGHTDDHEKAIDAHMKSGEFQEHVGNQRAAEAHYDAAAAHAAIADGK
jgi:hypothetical protein